MTKAETQKLQEARNVGEWLEARLHLMFTEIADGMFGEGRLTREERISLSSAIGGALDAFRSVVETGAAQLYTRDPWSEPALSTNVVESAIDGGFVALVEKAVRRDGTIPLKLIQPGWGSSGYYAKEVLERDGPVVFKPGTKMFWNHPSAVEDAERPEGDLNALAAELISAARWQDGGAEGAGLYADAKVFEAYQKPVEDLAAHIGVSIRASGRAVQGEAEGRKGPIIQSIVSARSVDFVTEPGAGGRIVQMFEAARPGKVGQLVSEPVGQSKGKGVDMTDVEKQFKEASDRLAALEEQNARLRESLLLRESRDFVFEQLVASTLPEVTKVRLAQSLGANPPVKDGALDTEVFAARIEEAVTAEREYLASVGAHNGQVTGMGGGAASAKVDPEAAGKRLKEGFTALGLSEKEAAHAMNGRRW